MELLARAAVVAGLVVAVPAAVWVAARIDGPGPTSVTVSPPGSGAASGAPPPVVGSSGCAAAACHGSPTVSAPGPGCWQSSATQWMASDPHTRAYAVLTDAPPGVRVSAKEIMRRYAGTDERGEPRVAATDEPRCLACHTNPTLATPTATDGVRALRADGVGCEACHGNAGEWYGSHTTWTAANREKEYGDHKMAPLYDVGERALVCAGCHVGAPADEKRGYPVRDMNHDMIAAGHPRLNFDFADYQARLPRHWFERDRLSPARPQPTRGPAFELQCWLVGRVATAEAACKLTADRATRANPWPEFAEFNCYSCHHELVPGGWKQTGLPPGTRRRPGSPPWQTIWPVTRPDDLAAIGGPKEAMAALLQVMEVPRPNAGPARDAADKVAAALAGLRNRFAKKSSEGDAAAEAVGVLDRVKQRVETKDAAAAIDWDTAAQAYLGAAAADRARRLQTGDTSEVSQAFRTALDRLRLPRVFEKGKSEKGKTEKEMFNSPRDLDPTKTREAIDEVLRSVVPKAGPP